MHFRPSLVSVLALAGSAAFAQQLSATTDFKTWLNVTEFPNQQSENVTRYLGEALRTAGADLYPHFRYRCQANQVYNPLASGQQSSGFIRPAKPFDGVQFVGESFVSSWAFDIGDGNNGVVLVDALNNPDEVKGVVLPGLAKFGYKGSDIRALIITHEHADHYGGARYLQDTFGIPAYATRDAWDVLEAGDPVGPKGLVPPFRNETLADGQELTFGNTTFSFVHTPGHTQGTVSFFVPVMDKGEKHLAGFYGGGGIPAAVKAKDQQIASFEKFANKAMEKGADVLMSNHQTQDNAIYNFDVIAAGASATNPFVIGKDAYVRYLKTMSLCVRVKAARDGQLLSI
ncbi:hypothetical protein PspLS_09363 [Pyricularia sp. CBS 133598]|nr:hypothetical protein PspLS_09363 [Pyricularia sp. CBS 133598]